VRQGYGQGLPAREQRLPINLFLPPLSSPFSRRGVDEQSGFQQGCFEHLLLEELDRSAHVGKHVAVARGLQLAAVEVLDVCELRRNAPRGGLHQRENLSRHYGVTRRVSSGKGHRLPLHPLVPPCGEIEREARGAAHTLTPAAGATSQPPCGEIEREARGAAHTLTPAAGATSQPPCGEIEREARGAAHTLTPAAGATRP
jgi:hypothetical protein